MLVGCRDYSVLKLPNALNHICLMNEWLDKVLFYFSGCG